MVSTSSTVRRYWLSKKNSVLSVFRDLKDPKDFNDLKIKNTDLYMKKNYVSPLAVEVSVATESMLAASLAINNNKTVDTSAEGGQLSGGSRGEWGNLW